jgi:hypothetical protein
MRALISPGPVELSGADPAAAKFAAWFGELSELELVQSGSHEVGDRLHVFYRLRVRRPGDSWKIVEQHLFCALDAGRVTALDLACSGFRPMRQEHAQPVAPCPPRRGLPTGEVVFAAVTEPPPDLHNLVPPPPGDRH